MHIILLNVSRWTASKSGTNLKTMKRDKYQGVLSTSALQRTGAGVSRESRPCEYHPSVAQLKYATITMISKWRRKISRVVVAALRPFMSDRLCAVILSCTQTDNQGGTTGNQPLVPSWDEGFFAFSVHHFFNALHCLSQRVCSTRSVVWLASLSAMDRRTTQKSRLMNTPLLLQLRISQKSCCIKN